MMIYMNTFKSLDQFIEAFPEQVVEWYEEEGACLGLASDAPSLEAVSGVWFNTEDHQEERFVPATWA